MKTIRTRQSGNQNVKSQLGGLARRTQDSTRRTQDCQGSALAVTLMTCAILGILMGSYLRMIQTQHLSVARSQAWNKAMVMAEAGVDEALALLNCGMLLTAPLDANNGARWTATSTTITRKPLTSSAKQQFDGSYYTVTISKDTNNPVITATGYVPVPISAPVVSRVVKVVTQPKPAFPIKAPMIVLNTFDANGYNIRTDSFDSSLTNLFPGGIYNSANAMDHGDVVSLSTNSDSVHVGNAKIKGMVRTPQGGIQGVTATIGSQGSVGDNNWVNNEITGFETGHFKDDVNLSFDHVVLPAVTFVAPIGGTYDGTNYTYLLNSTTPNYKVSALAGGQTIYVNSPNTILYVTGDVKVNTDQIRIAPGASLALYVGGSTASVGGNGIVNGSGAASNFIYYGLPSNTDLKFTGNASFIGSIYAPDTNFTLGGGGSDTYDFAGACVTKTSTMNGHFRFHYDDALRFLKTPNGYSSISWNEL